jgi:hypothetical protein
MDAARVATGLLETLDRSPLWPWDSPITLFAVIGEDPVVMLPALSIPTLGHLTAVAEQWREQLPPDTWTPEAMILATEGWLQPTAEDGTAQEGVRVEYREATLVEKDGSVTVLRHIRNGAISEVEVDPMAAAFPTVEAMRQVAASSWRD